MSSGQWVAFAMVYDPSAIASGTTTNLRYVKSQAFTITCPALYYGTYCDEKQNLTSSIIFGWLAGVLTLLITILFIWSDWPQRWAEQLRKAVTEKSVELARWVRA